MPTSTPLPRAFARLGALVAGVLTVGLVGLPAAHATDTDPTVSLTLAAGQSGSIGRVVSNTDVTAVSTCDPVLTVSFDATMNGTVTVAASAPLGSYTCSVDFQISGQSTGLVEHVFVDVVPGLSIDNTTVREGDVGFKPGGISTDGTDITPTNATFIVTMSEPSPTTVTVTVATADGTASVTDSPPDYNAVNTTVTFAPGQTSEQVTVQVNKDDTKETDETYAVTLSAPTDAVIMDGQGIGTIRNDDLGPIRVI